MKKLIKWFAFGIPIKGEDIINKPPTVHTVDYRDNDKFIYNDIMNNEKTIINPDTIN